MPDPKVMSSPKGLVPTFYKMIYRRVQCKHCGSVHSYDEVAAYVAVQGGYRGLPCNSMADIEWNLPVKVETAQISATPFCHMCFNPDLLRNLPKPDANKQRPITPSWAGTGLKTPPPKAKPKEPKGPKTYTIDDLDI